MTVVIIAGTEVCTFADEMDESKSVYDFDSKHFFSKHMSMRNHPLHSFHIPVMGLAFTIDSPIKVARFGIDSVLSIVEDELIEGMRKQYYRHVDRLFTPISNKEDDYRAKRITDYLNLVNEIVKNQIDKLREGVFEKGTELSRYFEMLPSNHLLRVTYQRMLDAATELEQQSFGKFLRAQIKPGRIDVNIMTKVDKDNPTNEGELIPESSDALSALRGYANSELTHSSVVFSAGLNPRLYNYLEKLPAFYAKSDGTFDKEIVIKVSDYRSALIQGKYLAKKGLWVSEFRIESGLNCGGHAFATDGNLMGPILEEFKQKRDDLIQSLFSLYQPALLSKGLKGFEQPHPIRITAQGGIGTFEESSFLDSYYNLSGTGWGSPFLLCPEATTVDEDTLRLLSEATEKDIVLSKVSPLGVRFNYLKGTSSELKKLTRIENGKPGSPCYEKYLVSNTEFSKEPICTASRVYQKQKIKQLDQLELPTAEYTKRYNDIVDKECLCIGLSNSAFLSNDLPPFRKQDSVTICPGPNMAYYSKVVTLGEMTDHIYGRLQLTDDKRPHMFIKELGLNINYLKEQMKDMNQADEKAIKGCRNFGQNLLDGIQYYRNLIPNIPCNKIRFEQDLITFENEMIGLMEETLVS